jgi:hypothetical protein
MNCCLATRRADHHGKKLKASLAVKDLKKLPLSKFSQGPRSDFQQLPKH